MAAVAVLMALTGGPHVDKADIHAQGGCLSSNPIVCENQLLGSSPSEWTLPAGPMLSGDPSIQGFPTDISIDQGQTIDFKIESGGPFRIDVYRMGYYAGNGARKVASLQSSPGVFEFPAQAQPDCLVQVAVGLIDCGNWSVEASWASSATSTSGIYFAKLTRTDLPDSASHMFFVVRDDDGLSPLLFQTSDTTWQAYNDYGGNSLYRADGPNAAPAGRAYKVSYNRPLLTADRSLASWIFNAEYPTVRWLEANGYNVSYTTGVDTDRRGAELLEHEIFLSVGHDEYWSGVQRANVEAARHAGVNLAFFSGNEVFWKTRWEPSIDGVASPHRTLVSYKETHNSAKIDPSPEWTGTWRDPRFSPPSDGGYPENALTGTIFTVNGPRTDAIQVPEEYGRLRFWRNTSIRTLAANQIPNQVAVLPPGTLGYEWDEDLPNGFRPPGLIRLSSTTVQINGQYLIDFGSNYGNGVGTHHLTLYRHPSGALVFGAGTVQWSWGLDGEHDRGSEPPSHDMQQATVNLFADMGVLPDSAQPGLLITGASTDTSAPVSTITFPAAGATVQSGITITLTGTASDTGGVVAGVEISTDSGATWHAALGYDDWTYNWTPASSGPVTVRSRAIDDTGNIETPGPGVPVNPMRTCPCTIWPDNAAPDVALVADPNAVELGVRFRAEIDGVVTGIRFYKGGAVNAGPHVGSLWTGSGQLLSSVTFTSETDSGWQQANFASPVPISANTTYVASYFAPVGNYSSTRPYFTSPFSNSPLTALADGTDGPNGVYQYGGGFPSSTFMQGNYWVDVVFASAGTADTTPPAITLRSPAPGATDVSPFTNVSATFNEALNPDTVTPSQVELRDSSNNLVSRTVSYLTATRTIMTDPDVRLADGESYTVTIRGGAGGVADGSGNALAADVSWSFTTAPLITCDPCTIFPPTAVPVEVVNNINDINPVELGTKFRTDVAGFITGIRFYKGNQFNAAPHVGTLWTVAGQMLAQATFTAETDSGWQEAAFTSPVPIVPNTTYVASYHTSVGRYSVDRDFFLNQGYSRGPLHALADGEDGFNGVYTYDPPLGVGGFPTESFRSSNYWVDVVFHTGTSNTPPTISDLGDRVTADATPSGPHAFTVTDAETAAPALTLGGTSNNPALVPDGNIVFGGSGENRTVTITPAASMAGTATITVAVTDGGGVTASDSFVLTVLPRVSVGDVSINEGSAESPNALVNATLSASSPQTVTVQYSTANGTAVAGSDYSTVSGTVSFSPGETSKTIPVPVVGDLIDEGNETFVLNLTNPVNAFLADAQSLVTIIDDDVSTLLTTTSASFATGTVGTATYVSETVDGEVILKPTRAQEFPGVQLAADWQLGSATGITVSGGSVTIDNNMVGPNATYLVESGHTVEGSVRFTGTANQNFGFAYAVTGGPYAWFTTKNGGNLYAQSLSGKTVRETLIPGTWFTAPHRFRVDWRATTVTFFVDGVQVASQSIGISGTARMRPIVRDGTADGSRITAEWVRMSPHSTPGTYASRVFDAGGPAAWANLAWNATTPAGTTVVMRVRTGNTPTPDATWTQYATIALSGGAINATARYLVFAVDMTTNAPLTTTPSVNDVTVTYNRVP